MYLLAAGRKRLSAVYVYGQFFIVLLSSSCASAKPLLYLARGRVHLDARRRIVAELNMTDKSRTELPLVLLGIA